MIYTELEKKAIIRVLCDMMMADGHRDTEEQHYLNQIKTMLGINTSSSSALLDQHTAFAVIANLSDDQKMEVAGMLQQMILADGVQDRNEMYLFGKIVTETGIDKAIEHKTAGMNIQHNNAQVYLNSSKVALDRRSSEFLGIVAQQAASYKNWASNYSPSYEELCNVVVSNTKDSVRNSGWDLNDVDGVTWFIANNVDAMVKARIVNDYDEMFLRCFSKYFN